MNLFSGPTGRSTLAVRNPSETILLCDGRGKQVPFSGEGAVINGIPISVRDFTVLGDRHGDGINVSFVDGHVKWMKYEDLLDVKWWKAR